MSGQAGNTTATATGASQGQGQGQAHAHRLPHPHLHVHSSSPKAAGYAFSLNLVRSLSLWSPDKAFPSEVSKPQYLPLDVHNGSVDWKELLRKFSKHNTSSQASIVAASARLELLIWRALDIKNVNPGPSQRRQDRKGKAPAVPNPPDELLIVSLHDQRNVRASLQELESALGTSGLDASYQTGAAGVVRALAYLTLGEWSTAYRLVHESPLATTADADMPTHDVDLKILAIVLRGMCLEHAASECRQRDQATQARATLEEAVQAYRRVPCSPPPPMPEAQKFVEMGLARLIQLERDSSTLQAHRRYVTLTSSFVAVPPRKRLAAYTSYLETLLSIIQTPHDGDANDAVSRSRTPTDAIPEASEVQNLFRNYEHLLQSTPSLASFPRAGEPTPNMTKYMDLLFAFWRFDLLQGEWVVDSLYRCLNKTYASQRLLRYLLFVLATVSFSSVDRKRTRRTAEDGIETLRLYLALFSKSRETDQKTVRRQLMAFRQRTEGIERTTLERTVSQVVTTRKEEVKSGEKEDANEADANDENDDVDDIESDDNFCSVCSIGTRLLLWESKQDNRDEAEDARMDLIKEAMETIELAQKYLDKKHPDGRKPGDRLRSTDTKTDDELHLPTEQEQEKPQSAIVAEVLLWSGVAKVEFALSDADPEVGRTRMKEAMRHLSKAISVLRTVKSQNLNADNGYRASLNTRALYSLAYAQLELRDVVSAIQTAKLAVESLPAQYQSQDDVGALLEAPDVRVWHLFALALSAKKDWKSAREAVELALFPFLSEREGENGEGSDDDGGGDDSQTHRKALTELADARVPMYSSPLEGASVKSPTTRADAPYDPAIKGVQARDMHSSTSGEVDSSATSSFVNVTLPDGTSRAQRSVSASSRNNPAAHSHHQPPPLTMPRRWGPGRMVVQRLHSEWDDLEAEIELLITRNKCIEAVEGPESALQDLQKNVFTRFSRRKEAIEASSSLHDNVNQQSAAVSPTGTSSIARYPYPSRLMKSKQPDLDDRNPDSASSTPTRRTRSIIGSIRNRNRAHSLRKTNTVQSDMLAVPGRPERAGSIRSNVSAADTASPDESFFAGEHSPRQNGNGNGNGVAAGFDTATNADATRPSTPLGPQSRVQNHHPRAARILARLWLAAAASFRRWGKFDECKGAINEAEDVAGNVDPDVWVQYTQYLMSSTETTERKEDERALLSLQKASSISHDHIPMILALASYHIDKGDVAIAEGFLDISTQANGWDCPEAWFLLAKVYEATRRSKRGRECLVYALGLEETRPIRELRATLERYL